MIKTAVMVPVADIFPNSWNPNEQSTDTFNALVEEIRQDGFEGGINVVPWLDHPEANETRKIYKIIGGEHRWRAAQVLGLTEIPCYIHEDWDEKEQILKTVRRNLLTGELNDAKFTALVRSLEEDYQVPKQDLPRLLGFDNESDFTKHIIEDKTTREKSFLDSLLNESKKDVEVTDSLTDIISTIFKDSGDTIDQNFIHFTYKGSLQTVVLLDKKGLDSVKQFCTHLRNTGTNANDFIVAAFESQIKSGVINGESDSTTKVTY